MRKFSVILLICTFALSQYARQLSYLQCILFNSAKPVSQQCDCARQAGLEKQDDKQAPLHKNHVHIRMDDFFSCTNEPQQQTFPIFSSTHSLPYPESESDGHSRAPWRPPDS